MGLPNDRFSPKGVIAPLRPPRDVDKVPLEAYERGGIAINNASQGLDYQDWVAVCDGSTIDIMAQNGERLDGFLTGVNITEIDLAFDQNMTPSIAYVEDGLAKFYWYDLTVGDYTTIELPDAVTPRCTLDDHVVKGSSEFNDVVLFYVRNYSVYYRKLRQRYRTEYLMGTGVRSINKIGMGVNRRFQLDGEPAL